MNQRFAAWTRRAGILLAAAGAIAPGARAAADNAPAAELTYTRDIAPIFMSNCAQCHKPGAIAPMALRTYEEVRPWAKSIRASVEKKTMPPWGANTPAGKFHNDMSLTDDQARLIVSWVEQGAPQGDPALMPAIPADAVAGWTLGVPDYIVDLGEIDVPASGDDYFPNIATSFDIPGDRWLRAAEVLPGNVATLHHVVAFLGMFAMGGDSQPAAGVKRDPNQDRGRANMGGRGGQGGGNMGGGGNPLDANIPVVWAVGSPPQVYPEGMGKPIKAGSAMTVNMHYHPNGTAQKDHTKIGFYFGSGPIQKEINIAFAGTFAINIPANAEDHIINSAYFFDEDSKIVSFFPHMHQRGKAMKYTATFPDGRKEVLLDVPRYSFNWQWFYYPNQLIDIPAGTRVDVEAHYDNSSKNPNNPDPSMNLTFGEQSNDEMCFGVMEYISEKGVKPGPINVREKIKKLMAAHPVDSSYVVAMKMRGMAFPTGLYLPREGAGMWYLAFGRQLMSIELKNIKWDGDKFAFDMASFGGGKPIVASGAVDADGQISAEFDFSGFEEAVKAREAAQASLPEKDPRREPRAERGDDDGDHDGGGMGGFMMKGFSGARIDVTEKKPANPAAAGQ